ncbi:MAG TPA: response regulator [Chloroflexi bacterium]|mgnify:CR=1 FL=1|nr:response regulator [Chloroflexota bacterium]
MNTIIVVDDDQVFCGLLKTVLEFEDYQVIVESNPSAVVDVVRQNQPILVLMDLHAKRGDTLGVLKQLRTDDATRSIPVVMTSGMDRSDICLAAGADAFLLKPFRPDELTALVAQILQKGETASG